MSIDHLFQLDTSGQASHQSSRLFYNTIGDLEITNDDSMTRPSQDRPAILKQKAKRYHEQDIKKKFTPGQLSDGLRKALGLKRHDIPIHIYRMRHLGYPPGWLKKAEVKLESITIFGANNDVITGSVDKNVKYDWEMLHEFPGFNSKRQYDNRYDYASEMGYLAMQEDCLLENFKRFLWNNHMLDKEATDIRQIRSAGSVRNSATDFNLPASGGPVSRAKRRGPMSESTPSKRVKVEQVELSEGELEDDDMVCCDDESSVADDSVAEPTRPISDAVVASTATENGTVLLITSAQLKPSLDRFSEGINEHRLFENLPNAGGTYQKVKSVLKKIHC